MKEEGVSMPAGEGQAAGEATDPGGGGLGQHLLANVENDRRILPIRTRRARRRFNAGRKK